MWIKGERPDRNGVVSRSHSSVPDIDDTPRNVANGIFVELLGNKTIRIDSIENILEFNTTLNC